MPSVLVALLIASVAIGLPALLIVLWSLLKGFPARGARLRQLSQGILMVLGGVFVIAGIAIPLLLFRMIPLEDEELLRIAPAFKDVEFAYAAPFSGDMADFEVESKEDQVCLHFSSKSRYQGYGGWQVILWSSLIAKFFQQQGYPQDGRNLLGYRTLSFEAKADQADAILQVALKDRRGREPRMLLPRRERGEQITTDFSVFTLDLANDFRSPTAPPPDLTKIETISFAVNVSQILSARRELPAEGEEISQTVCIKNLELK